MITIDNFNFSKQRALIRVDFNVPLDKQFHITDDSRIRGAIPTIKKILADGGSVILMSHLGRPLKKLKEDGTIDYNKFTLRHTVKDTSDLIGCKVKFVSDCISDDAFVLSKNLKPGEVLLLENLRFYKEEEKGDEGFAKKLSAHGDIYVNDAFGTAHRAHASTTIIAKFFPGKKCFGYLMARELENAAKVMSHAQHPFTAIMGGAKVSDKILILENLISKADNIIIGGGMAYTFFKAKGGSIGNSLVEEDKLHLALEIIDKAKTEGCNLLLPVDSKIANLQFPIDAAKAAQSDIKETDNMNIPQGFIGLDIGSKATTAFSELIEKSKTILWNGPMGVFEIPQFENGTRKVAEAIANATSKGAYSLIGGGDSAAAINQFVLAEKVSYVSTGGGALLEYFEGKVLPGVKAIQD